MKNLILLPLIFFTSLFFLLEKAGKQVKIDRHTEDSLKIRPITFLDLSQRNLKVLPSNIDQYKDLEVLDLSENPITALDPKILELKKLRTLKLNHCMEINLEQATEMISHLPLEELEMNHCFLMFIPENLYAGTSLKKLSLKDNQIKEIPEEFPLDSRLEFLDLANNKIDSLPEETEAFSWLTYLDLSYNPCLNHAHTYQRIWHLDNLKSLVIDGAPYIGNELSQMPALRELSLKNSKISHFPNGFSSLNKLNVENCEELNYPLFFNSVQSNDSLQELYISSVRIMNLPDELNRFSQMRIFSIGENSIGEIPENIRDLKNLRELRMQLKGTEEKTERMMNRIAGCKNLENLDLSNSEFNSISPELHKLGNLKVLSLESSKLNSLPGKNLDFSSLEEMNVRGTPLNKEQILTLKAELPKVRIVYDLPFAVPENLQEELFSKKEAFTINASVSNTLNTRDGTQIKIPANAFVDEKGKPVKGEVTLNFQPYYSPAQIYLSGIPMTYDSGGVKNSFQSAGMFNIGASADGKELQLAKQKKIKVDFQSLNPGRNYNYYVFDRSKNNWVYKGNDSGRVSAARPITRNFSPARPEIDMPQRPRANVYCISQNTTKVYFKLRENKGRREYVFWLTRGYKRSNKRGLNLKDEVNDYLHQRNRWVYQVDDKATDFFAAKKKERKFFSAKTMHDKDKKIMSMSGPEYCDIDIVVRPDREKDRFNVVFRFRNDSIVLPAYPEYHSTMANRIQVKTKKEYDKYLLASAKRRSAEDRLEGIFQKELQDYEQKMAEYREKMKKLNAEEREGLDNMKVDENRITRSLVLDGLGAWNCDVIYSLQNGVELLTRLYHNHEKLNVASITIIDQTNNGYGSYANSKIIIDRYVNNVLIAKLGDGRFGYVKFKVTDKDIKSIDLALNILDTKNMSMREFNEQVFN